MKTSKIPANLDFAKTIFEQYLKTVYPVGQVPPDQLEEITNAFYAGMWAAFHEVKSVSEAMPERVAIAMLKKFEDDCYARAKVVLDKMYARN